MGQGFPEKATSELGVESERCCLQMSGIWARLGHLVLKEVLVAKRGE